MGILDELSSVTGDKNSNKEMVKRCLTTPALLHSIAEGLRTGTPKSKVDCAQILIDVGKRRIEFLADFVADFLDATRNKSARIAKLGFGGLTLVVEANPAEVYAERDYLMSVAKENGKLAQNAAGVLAALCGNNPNYRGKLLGNLVRLLNNVEDDELVKWVTAIGPAVEGSADSIKRLNMVVEGRKAGLPADHQKKLDKLLLKLERSTARKK
jgi:hypothetical protein